LKYTVIANVMKSLMLCLDLCSTVVSWISLVVTVLVLFFAFTLAVNDFFVALDIGSSRSSSDSSLAFAFSDFSSAFLVLCVLASGSLAGGVPLERTLVGMKGLSSSAAGFSIVRKGKPNPVLPNCAGVWVAPIRQCKVFAMHTQGRGRAEYRRSEGVKW
jgi:hypothetical protein